jgi:quinol monooxygenase YgiN
MIVVNGIIKTTTAAINAISAALSKMEQASQAEDGCFDYTFSIEVSEPTVIRLTERWASMEDLKRHFAEPHMTEFQAAMAEHPPTSVEVKFYQAEEIDPPGR